MIDDKIQDNTAMDGVLYFLTLFAFSLSEITFSNNI